MACDASLFFCFSAMACISVFLQPHLDVSTGVDLVNCISRGTSSLSIQVVALDKHCVVTQTTHPDVSFTFALQLDSFANVESKIRGVNIIILPRDLPLICPRMWQHTSLSLCSLFCGHYSAGPGRSDPLRMDPHSHPQSR